MLFVRLRKVTRNWTNELGNARRQKKWERENELKHRKYKTHAIFQKYKSFKRKKAETIFYQQTETTVREIQDYAYMVITLLNNIWGDAAELNKIKDRGLPFRKKLRNGVLLNVQTSNVDIYVSGLKEIGINWGNSIDEQR